MQNNELLTGSLFEDNLMEYASFKAESKFDLGKLSDTLQWEILEAKGATPSARGYHTLTTVGNSVVLFGGKGDRGICTSNNNLRLTIFGSSLFLVVSFVPLMLSKFYAGIL